jgi:hypothetical protein
MPLRMPILSRRALKVLCPRQAQMPIFSAISSNGTRGTFTAATRALGDLHQAMPIQNANVLLDVFEITPRQLGQFNRSSPDDGS